MRAIHVIPSISQEASGPTYSVVRLCRELHRRNVDVSLAAIASPGDEGFPEFVKGFEPSPGPARLGFSGGMRRWLSREVEKGTVNIVHNHSFWMMPNLYAGWAARRGKARLVVSPRGTLAPEALAISRAVKQLFWPSLQRPAVSGAACFHATADSELGDIRRMGFAQPIAVIPNGVELSPLADSPHGETRTLLYLGRLHPIKGLDILVRAWARIAAEYPAWRLLIAGPSERGHLEQLQQLAGSSGAANLEFQGPLYGDAKLAAYRDASLFILPSRSENFGMTVAEALAAGTPCITTQGTPWKAIAERRAGWWIPLSEADLAACLRAALAKPPAELQAMGRRGRNWMAGDFSWERIGYMMEETYRWLLAGGRAPAWVDGGASGSRRAALGHG